MALFKGKKAPSTPLLGSTAAEMEAAKAAVQAGPEKPTDLPIETDPNILEAQRMSRRKAKSRRGLSSTIMTGGSLGDNGYGSSSVLG